MAEMRWPEVRPLADVGALADALQRLLVDPSLRDRMGAAGRARQELRFSVQTMIDGVERAYAQALETTHG